MTFLTQQVMTDPKYPKGMDRGSVNFMSWNVKSLNHPIKRKRVFTHLKQLNTDIAFLQETHIRTADLFRIRKGWVGQLYHSSFRSKTRGAAILINKNIPFTMASVDSGPAGRYIIVLYCVYADDMLLFLSQHLVSLPKLMVLLKDFGKISGYKVNIQKSELMPVGTSNVFVRLIYL